MDQRRRQLLAKVAYLYYIEDKTQQMIAEELDIYRTTISRMLTEAKEQRIIEFKIHDFNTDCYHLEDELKRRFHLRHVAITPTEDMQTAEEKEAGVSKEAAHMLQQLIKNGDVVGVSWGESIGKTIKYLDNKYYQETTFLPIVGGPSHVNSRYHVNTIVYELARHFHGQSLFVNATVIQESKLIANEIVQAKYFAGLRDMWRKLDVVVVGVGGHLSYQRSHWRDLLTADDYEDLRLREAIGDCCCRFIDREGKVLKGLLDERTIGVPLARLKQIPLTIAIARGKVKARAIYTLVKYGYINTLVTDQETALEMLRMDDVSRARS